MIEDDAIDEIRDLSPIPMPKSHQMAPDPHPHPIVVQATNAMPTKMSLAQLRKFSISGSTKSISSSSTILGSPQQNIKNKKPTKPLLEKHRINQLLRIQSGNYEKRKTNERQNTNMQ